MCTGSRNKAVGCTEEQSSLTWDTLRGPAGVAMGQVPELVCLGWGGGCLGLLAFWSVKGLFDLGWFPLYCDVFFLGGVFCQMEFWRSTSLRRQKL